MAAKKYMGRRADRLKAVEAIREAAKRACGDAVKITVWEPHAEDKTCSFLDIDVSVEFKGVGAMIMIAPKPDNTMLVNWYNAPETGDGKYHDFSKAFVSAVAQESRVRPHHKETTYAQGIEGVAWFLEAGMLVAKKGNAFVEGGE